MATTSNQQAAASLVAWLDMNGTRQLLRLLLTGSYEGATAYLAALFPDLPPEYRMSDPTFVEHLIDALENRVSPPDEDLDRLPTELVPDYARFATDLRDAR